jgi:hypothetical protein
MSEGRDRKFYQAIRGSGLAERVLIAARDRIYADFIRSCGPTAESTILDVGVSDVIHNGANFLEQKYPHPHRITACGLSEALDFQATFGEVRYLQIKENSRLPFRDKQFDIATSNAVLEHVGSEMNQIRFVNELCRVAAAVFVSVPNRFFPVEHHTAVPFLHWSDTLFSATCAVLGKDEWREEGNLILMTRRRLTGLLPRTRSWTINYTGLRLGAFSSNIYAFSSG